MASYRNFENNRSKFSDSANIFKKSKQMVREKDYAKERHDRLKLWTTFYRRNVHRFVQHYFDGIILYPYQYLWIYLMSKSDIFMAIAARGIAKSFIVAVYSCAIAILYPSSEIVVAAGSAKQALLIITDKIEKILMKRSSNLCREIKKVTKGKGEGLVEFHNGSTIKVVTSSDGARGNRATINIYDEFRLINKGILDSVLSPFLYSRQRPFLQKPQYKHLIEEPKEIYISSAWYKSEWIWAELKKFVSMHYRGNDRVNFLGFDYHLAVHHGLKTKNQMAKEREKSDEITFMMEYENIMFGENENAYFKLSDMRKNQILKNAFYPIRSDMVGKKNKYEIKRTSGEIRIISVDVATRKGSDNDNTIISCFRLLPTSKGYQREVVYFESHNGENTILQTLRIKQIYNDFKGDYLVLDIQNAGISIYEQLGMITKDEERGCEYDAYTIVQDKKFIKEIKKEAYEELLEKTLATNAIPIIFPISAYQKLNSNIAVALRDNLVRGKISLLVEEHVAEDFMISKNSEYKEASDLYTKLWLLHPYEQTKDFVNETVNLEYKIQSGNIVIDEGRGRKDRYTSVSYGNYFASILERDLLKEKTKFNWSDYRLSSKSKLRK